MGICVSDGVKRGRGGEGLGGEVGKGEGERKMRTDLWDGGDAVVC